MRFRLLVALLSGSLYADVGSIAELRGIGDVIRQNTTDPLLAELALGIMSYDRVRTGNGRMAIEFEDASVLKLTEQSQIVVTEYVYKQGSKDNKLSLNLVSGTSRFITSKLNRIAKENIKLTTPSATIGVLGTEFLVSVSVLGESTIINLPKENGEVGKIFVDTEGGRVILDKPFQATVATVSMQPPTKPVTISGLSLNALDNMLLVNPPDEIEQAVEDQEQSSNDLLDTDFLDDSEFLEEEEYEDELEIDRLSIDLLSIDYLLDIITDVLQETETEVQNLGDITIEGITVGYDPEKQLYSFVEGEYISFVRQVENTVDLQLDKSGKYDLEILTGAQLIKIKVNGGGDGTIIINQSD